MMLFKREHIGPILAGRKTQTRRTWAKPRVRIGSTHQARVSYYVPPFAHLRIVGLRRERLGDISEADAYREGYASIANYRTVFEHIYGRWQADEVVWVVDFEVQP